MKLENVRKYMEYQADNYPTLSVLKNTFSFVFLFICLLGAIMSIASSKYVCFIIITAYSLIYRIAIGVFQRKCTTPYYILRFFAKGTLSTVMSVFFLLFIFLILEVTDRITAEYIFLLTALYLIVLALWFFVILLSVKKDMYGKTSKRKTKKSKKRKKQRNDNVAYGIITIFAVLGAIFGRIVSVKLKSLNQDVVIMIFVGLVFIVIAVCAFGTTEFLKCHYALKYPIVDKSEWEHGSEGLMAENQDKPWIFGRVLIVFEIIVFAAAIIGFLMMKLKS